MSRKFTSLHLVASFAFGILVGGLAVKKGCPPVPVPGSVEPPPVSAPTSTAGVER